MVRAVSELMKGSRSSLCMWGRQKRRLCWSSALGQLLEGSVSSTCGRQERSARGRMTLSCLCHIKVPQPAFLITGIPTHPTGCATQGKRLAVDSRGTTVGRCNLGAQDGSDWGGGDGMKSYSCFVCSPWKPISGGGREKSVEES